MTPEQKALASQLADIVSMMKAAGNTEEYWGPISRAADFIANQTTQKVEVTGDMIEAALEAFMDAGEFCNMEYRQKSMRAAILAALEAK